MFRLVGQPYLRFTHAIFVCVITVYKLNAISYSLFMHMGPITDTVVSLYPHYVSPISQDIKPHVISSDLMPAARKRR